MTIRLTRMTAAAVAAVLVLGACSSTDDSEGSSRGPRNAALPTPWTQTVGTPDSDVNSSIAVDDDGNVIVVGSRSVDDVWAAAYETHPSGVVNVAMRPSSPKSGNAMTLTKHDPSGATTWSIDFESTYSVTIAGVALNSKGYIYVAGSTVGDINFDPESGSKNLLEPGSPELMRGFVARFAPDGQFVAVMTVVATPGYVQDLAIDASGNVVVVGAYMNGLTIYSDRKSSLAGTSYFQTFVTRLNSDLSIQWLKGVSSSGYSSPSSVAVDSSGNIVFNTTFSGYLMWDAPLILIPTAAPSQESRVMRVASHPRVEAVLGGFWTAGLLDAVVYKINPSGGFIWGVQLGGIAYDSTGGIGVDSKDNVYVSGTFGGASLAINPNPAGLAPASNTSAKIVGYLAKISSDGSAKFLKSIGTSDDRPGSVEPGRLVVAADGTTTVAGSFSGTVSFGDGASAGTVTSDEHVNTFAVSYSSEGKFKWVRTFIGGFVIPTDVAIDDSGNSYFSGSFNSNLVIDDARDTAVGVSKGSNDGFLVKLSSLGASAKAGTDVPKVTTAPQGPSTLPTLDDVISGITPPEISDVRVVPDNVPPGINTTLAKMILTVKVKKTITLKSILSSVGIAPSVGAKTAATISAKSKKNCSATTTKLKGLKVGTCTLTIKVTPKKGKSTKSKVSVVVVK